MLGGAHPIAAAGVDHHGLSHISRALCSRFFALMLLRLERILIARDRCRGNGCGGCCR